MQGGTTFTFVTDGVDSALEQARAAAGDRNVAIAGGAHTINEFLAAGLIDELRLHIALQQVSARQASLVTHLVYRVSAPLAAETAR
jgi:dihydrofolate reductase